MIEAASIPVLVKVLDFLFDEGRKILQERRERRKKEQSSGMGQEEVPLEAAQDPAEVPAAPEPAAAGPPADGEPGRERTVPGDLPAGPPQPMTAEPVLTKEQALGARLETEKWRTLEAEVTHLSSLLEVYKKNYYLAREQYAKFGGAMVPQIIVHNLSEAEEGIASTSMKLREVLKSVFGQELQA